MNEPLFGTAAPPWPGAPSPVFGWQTTAGNRGLSATPASFGVPQAVAVPFAPGTFAPTALLSEQLAGFNGPALLAAVAIRRGQPLGPTTDQDIEDFLYDAIELLPGTSDVEVRVEGGRVLLTGSVSHKRVKHDIGELGWAIPSASDVQNNVTIAARRRARSERREAEAPLTQKPKDR